MDTFRFRRSRDRQKIKGYILRDIYGFVPVYVDKRVFWKKRYPCYICKAPFSFKELTLEHLIPISRGGAARDIRNIDVACATCNNVKNDKTIDEIMVERNLPSYLFPRRGIREEEL